MATQTVSRQSNPAAAHQESHTSHAHGLLATIAKEIALLNEWLAGPPMTELERKHRLLAETESIRKMGAQGF